MSNLNNINLEENLYEDYKGDLEKHTAPGYLPTSDSSVYQAYRRKINVIQVGTGGPLYKVWVLTGPHPPL